MMCKDATEAYTRIKVVCRRPPNKSIALHLMMVLLCAWGKEKK